MALSEESDEALMGLYSQGHPDAFLELFSRYEGRLMGYFKRRLWGRDSSEVDDLFQMVWLKVHQAKKNFEVGRKFSSWFFTIAINTLRDFYRGLDWLDEVEDQNIGESSNVEIQFELKRLEEALPLLTLMQREVLLLSDWEGFQAEEIATMLGVKSSNVRQILHRARERLREKLNAAG